MALLLITADDIITSSGKYPARAKHPALPAMRGNASILADKINAALDELGYTGPRKASSGYRTPESNATTPGSAKRSLHMECKACDFETQAIGRFIRSHPQGPAMLRKHGLFMEALESTPNWTHIDMGTRADRPNREFKP